jgi:4-aminobutyrate aminotransferase-like enzyme
VTLDSTHAGNPERAAAALAVLDVIDDERVLDRVQRTGRALGGALAEVAAGQPEIADVRGVGLAWGVEFAGGADRTRAVRDRMRHHGVLVGTTGRAGDVLKIRPPLAFDERHVPAFLAAFEAALRR